MKTVFYQKAVVIASLLTLYRTVIDIINIPKDFSEGFAYLVDNFNSILIVVSIFLVVVIADYFIKKKLSQVSNKEEDNQKHKYKRVGLIKILGAVKMPLVVLGVVSFFILSFLLTSITIKYLTTKEFYYVQIGSASTNQSAVNYVVTYNNIFKENDEKYLRSRALETSNGSYMITIRRGFMYREHAEEVLRRTEELLDDDKSDNRIYSTVNISLKKKLLYMLGF